MTARILYENHMANATSIVASSEAAGYPVANIADYIPTDYFRSAASGTINITVTMPAPVTADCFAIFNQDLFKGAGTFKLQYYNGSIYVDCFTAVTPTDNTPDVVTFPSQTATLWRIVLTSSQVVNLGIAYFGRKLDLPYGNYLNASPPSLARSTDVLNSVADAGSFLGRSIVARGIKSTLTLQYATETYVRASWLPFMKHMEEKPFFFQPYVEQNEADVAFCWTDGEPGRPAYTHYKRYMGCSTAISGLVE